MGPLPFLHLFHLQNKLILGPLLRILYFHMYRPEDIKWPVEIDYDALALQQAQEKERAEAIKWPVEID